MESYKSGFVECGDLCKLLICDLIANWKVRDDEGVKKEQEICLSSFDEYYDLLLKVNPRFAKDKFFFSFKFEHGDPITGNLLFQHNEIQMEVLLAHVRNSIVTYGTTCFLKLIDILCDQEPYKEIGFHMLGRYDTHTLHIIWCYA